MPHQWHRLQILDGDLPSEALQVLSTAGTVAWDIETTGLDWDTDLIATCQLAALGGPAYIIRMRQGVPANILALLADASVMKVFHHAMFDLRFMAHWWKAAPANVACTKVASKLLDPKATDHSLKGLLLRHLGVSLDKSQQRSDWSAERLTEVQIDYAVNDVVHLPELLCRLQAKLQKVGLRPLLDDCFAHIPTRVRLDLLHYPDVYTY